MDRSPPDQAAGGRRRARPPGSPASGTSGWGRAGGSGSGPEELAEYDAPITGIRIGRPRNFPFKTCINGVGDSLEGSTSSGDAYAPVDACLVCASTKMDHFADLGGLLTPWQIDAFKGIVRDNNGSLLHAVNEYKRYGRHVEHFMYDLIVLVKYLGLPSAGQWNRLLGEITTPTTLFHNRTLLEIYHDAGRFHDVAIVDPGGSGASDIIVGGIRADIKCIMPKFSNVEAVLDECIHRLGKIFEKEAKTPQVGKDGTFVVALWSGHAVSRILEYTGYRESRRNFPQLSRAGSLSVFPPQSVIFVIPGVRAFESEYLVIEKNLALPLLRWCRGLKVGRHTDLVYRTRHHYGYRHCIASDRFLVVIPFS